MPKFIANVGPVKVQRPTIEDLCESLRVLVAERKARPQAETRDYWVMWICTVNRDVVHDTPFRRRVAAHFGMLRPIPQRTVR